MGEIEYNIGPLIDDKLMSVFVVLCSCVGQPIILGVQTNSIIINRRR